MFIYLGWQLITGLLDLSFISGMSMSIREHFWDDVCFVNNRSRLFLDLCALIYFELGVLVASCIFRLLMIAFM